MPWLRVSVCTRGELADGIAARLTTAGAVAVTLTPAWETVAVVEPAPDTTPLWDSVRLEGLFDLDADVALLAGLDFEIDFVADRDWSDTWREGYRPRRFGRLVVLPRDADVQPRRDEVVVRLDPGLAFGTGSHPTTALCLEQLARVPRDGTRILDVGSGSGILAIAAARLGGTVVAVDHDPQARRATLENGQYNDVEIDIEDRLETLDSQFDLVLANLVAGTIRDCAEALVERLAAGGELVLSGILSGQAEWVMDAFSRLEIQFDVPTVRDGWVMLRGLRCPNPRLP